MASSDLAVRVLPRVASSIVARIASLVVVAERLASEGLHSLSGETLAESYLTLVGTRSGVRSNAAMAAAALADLVGDECRRMSDDRVLQQLVAAFTATCEAVAPAESGTATGVVVVNGLANRLGLSLDEQMVVAQLLSHRRQGGVA